MLASRQAAGRSLFSNAHTSLKHLFFILIVGLFSLAGLGEMSSASAGSGGAGSSCAIHDTSTGNELLAVDTVPGNSNSDATRLALVRSVSGLSGAVQVPCSYTQNSDGKSGTWTSSQTVTHILVKASTVQEVFDVADGTSGTWSTACIVNNGGQQPAVSGVFCYSTQPPANNKGTITVLKQTEGGTGKFDFTLTGQPSFSLDTSNANPKSSGAFTLAAGNGEDYTITETSLPSGEWELQGIQCTSDNTSRTFSPDVGNKKIEISDLAEGENVTCTFTNKVSSSADKGTIKIIKKTVDGSDNPKAINQDFVVKINGTQVDTLNTGVNSNPDMTAAFSRVAGEYTVSEDTASLPDNIEVVSGICKINNEAVTDKDGSDSNSSVKFDLIAGQNVECTFINKVKAVQGTKLKIRKFLKDVNGKDVPNVDFEFIVFQPTSPPVNQVMHAKSGGTPSDAVEVVAGYALSVGEYQRPDAEIKEISCEDQNGDKVSKSGDARISIPRDKVNDGDVWECTFTNVKVPTRKLIIRKQVEPQTDAKFTFTPSPNLAANPDTFQLEDYDLKGDQQVLEVPVGQNFTVTETEDPLFDVTSACHFYYGGDPVDRGGKSVTVKFSETSDSNARIICTFTNTRRTGSLDVIKKTVGGDGQFDFKLDGLVQKSFQLSGGQKLSDQFSGPFPAGGYKVEELNVPEGWKLTKIKCESDKGGSNNFTISEPTPEGQSVAIDLHKDENVVCTFTNLKKKDDKMEDVTKVFIHRRVDNLLTHEPDRARLLRRLNEERPEGLKDGGLKDGGSQPPLKMSGQMDNEGGSVKFSTSLSRMRASYAAAQAKKAAEAKQSSGDNSLPWGDDPYLAPFVAARPGWDLWIEGEFTRYDDSTGGINREGQFKILYVGADYALAPGVIVGALVQVDRTDEDVNDPSVWGQISGTGWMVGPYFGAKISDSLMFDARAAWGKSSNDVSLNDPDAGSRTGSFGTDRWLVSAKLTGLWYNGPWRFSPHIGLAWGNENQDAYKNSLGQSIGANSATIGRLTFGPEFGYRTTLENGMVIEPHIAVEGIWNFDVSDMVIGGKQIETEGIRAKVEGGVIFLTPDGYKLRAAGSYDGLGDEDLEAWSAKAWLNIPLN